MFYYELNDTVYKRQVYLVVGSREEFRAHVLTRHGGAIANKVSKHCLGLTLIVDDKSKDDPNVTTVVYYVWLTKWDNTPRSWGLLAHECYHAVCAAFSEMDVEITDEEAVAYYLDAMVSQFGDQLVAQFAQGQSQS